MEQLFDEQLMEEVKGSFETGHIALGMELIDYQKDRYLVQWKSIPSKKFGYAP